MSVEPLTPAEIAAYQQDIDEWPKPPLWLPYTIQTMQRALATIAAQSRELETLRGALRDALAAFKDAEWTRPQFGNGAYFCPACRNFPARGHDAACYIKANIAALASSLPPVEQT